MPNVFRWNIARREQLGRLVTGEPAESFTRELVEVRRSSARVIAMAGDARLVFVGRSPEPLFDYLTGAFGGTSWAERIALLNVSLKGSDADWRALDSRARAALCEHLCELGLDPAAIATGAYPVAFVDIICDGETFGKLLDFLFSWAKAERLDTRAVRRRLRIVGITTWYAKDPAARRWTTCRWKELEWATPFRAGLLKGVSVPDWFWSYLGDSVEKVSRSNPPERWADPEMARPPRESNHVEALRSALALFESGRTRAERDALAAALSEQPSIRHVWCRVLAAELRAASRPKRVERTFTSKHRVRSWRRHVHRRTSFRAR